MSLNKRMPRFGYKASEFPDVISIFGKCRGKAAIWFYGHIVNVMRTLVFFLPIVGLLYKLFRGYDKDQSLIPNWKCGLPVVTYTRCSNLKTWDSLLFF